MQESQSAEFEGVSRAARARQTLSTAAGTVVALGLVGVTAAWFYQLGARDVTDVPIIQAKVTPAKVRPADPGGAVAPYQNISSYSVADDAPVPAGEITLAPPPAAPARADIAMDELPPVGSEAPDDALALVRPANAAVPVPAVAPADEAPAPGADMAELPAAAPVEGGTEFAPARSPIAPVRPSDLKARMAAGARAAEQMADSLAQRAASSAYQVQLAAAPKESIVHDMWQRISAANADLLRDRALAVQTTTSGGMKFYRLRVGPFKGVNEARAVCQALKARGQDCIVARNG